MRLPGEPTLHRFLRELESLGDPEELFARDGRSIVAFDGEQGCSRIVFVTKQYGLIGLRTDDRRITAGAAGIICCYSLVTAESAAFVAEQVRRRRAELCFVGDLDPHDLTIFLTLAVELKKLSVPVRYSGINDAWIELCNRFLPEPDVNIPGKLPTVPLDAYEQEHLRLLNGLAMSWDEVVGPASMAMLRGGSKLELEGASNPGCYREGFSGELKRFIFGSP
jgi:hypothetical protein